jgi:hypothetical protein
MKDIFLTRLEGAMKRLDVTLIVGLGLVLVGGLFLLHTLGVVEGVLPLLWVVVFAASGLIFLYFFWINREHWWALIPGFTLLGLGVLIGLSEYGPKELEDVAAFIFLASIGLSFWLIYFFNREHWWAIIPGGVLFSVAVIAGLEQVSVKDDVIASIFFLGLALTFGAIALLPTPYGRMKWAWIPASILFVIGLIIFSAAVSAFKYLWPAGVILVGLYILYRALFGRKKDQGELQEQ